MTLKRSKQIYGVMTHVLRRSGDSRCVRQILALFPWLDFGSPLVIYICR